MSFSGKTILLVEDDMVSAIVISSFLEEWNLSVHRAHNGAEAVRMIQEDMRFDLILMDISMPLMDGIQATAEIRKKEIRTPIIVVTGDSRDADILAALSAGANDYIFKPVSERQLFHTVTKLLPMES